MELTGTEEEMASGRYGPGIEKCMKILIKFGEAFGAKRMVKIASAHTMPTEPPDLLEEMTEGVTQTGAFTTLHSLMSAFDPHCWKKMGIPEEYAARELPQYKRRHAVYRRLGFYQTYTCMPMLVGNLPRMGDYVSWIGSEVQLFANSLIGARTNRDGTVVNLAAAITGLMPYMELFKDEKRFAEVLVELNGLDPYHLTHTDFGAMGYYLGGKAEHRHIVIDGMPREMDIDQLKYFMAPLSASGSVSICHIVGLTPEALTLKQALGNRQPSEVIKVGKDDIERMKALYDGGNKNRVDMVIFGCPHCTIVELKMIASLLEEKKLKPDRRLWIGLSYQAYHLARTMGYTEIIEKAGGVIASACMAAVPDFPIPEGVELVATNSFKAAHYISRMSKGRTKVLIRDMEDCIETITVEKKGGSL